MRRITFTILTFLTTLFWGNYASGWRGFEPPTILDSTKEAHLINTSNFILKYHALQGKQRMDNHLFTVAIDLKRRVRSEWAENGFAYDPEANRIIYLSTTMYTSGASGAPDFDPKAGIKPYGYLMTPSLEQIKVYESNERISDLKWVIQMAKLKLKVRHRKTNAITTEEVYAQYGYASFEDKTRVVFDPCLSKDELLNFEILSRYPEAVTPLYPNRFITRSNLTKIPILKNKIGKDPRLNKN